MKTTTTSNRTHVISYEPHRPCRHASRYPNAADRRYYIGRLVDGLLAVVTGLGFVSVLCFLTAMA